MERSRCSPLATPLIYSHSHVKFSKTSTNSPSSNNTRSFSLSLPGWQSTEQLHVWISRIRMGWWINKWGCNCFLLLFVFFVVDIFNPFHKLLVLLSVFILYKSILSSILPDQVPDFRYEILQRCMCKCQPKEVLLRSGIRRANRVTYACAIPSYLTLQA